MTLGLCHITKANGAVPIYKNCEVITVIICILYSVQVATIYATTVEGSHTIWTYKRNL